MRHLALMLFVTLQSAFAILPAMAQDKKGIMSYQETVDLAADGAAAVTIKASVADWPSDFVDLPLNFAKPENVSAASDGAKVAASIARVGDVRVMRLKFAGKPPAEANVRVTFTAREFLDWKKARSPRGIYGLSYTFTNNVMANIGQYRLQVLLPEGYEMNGVTSSTPRMTGEEVQPPYEFASEGKRTIVTLRSKSVGPGRTAAIAFGFVKAERNPLPFLIVGLLIAVAALWFKRDVLTRADYARETAG